MVHRLLAVAVAVVVGRVVIVIIHRSVEVEVGARRSRKMQARTNGVEELMIEMVMAMVMMMMTRTSPKCIRNCVVESKIASNYFFPIVSYHIISYYHYSSKFRRAHY